MVKIKLFNRGFIESSLIGRIAKDIIISIFEESGYQVYPFGYESIFAGLKGELHKYDQRGSETVKRIRSMPDLLVIDKGKNPYLVEVKFSSYESYTVTLNEKIKWYKKYWPDSFLIYVTQGYCNFYCQKVEEIEELSLLNFRRLDEIFSQIDLNTLIKYKPYLINLAQISSNRRPETHQPHNFIPFVFKILRDEENKLDLDQLQRKLCERVVLLSKAEIKESIDRKEYNPYILVKDENVYLTQQGVNVAERIADNWDRIVERWKEDGLTYTIVDGLLR